MTPLPFSLIVSSFATLAAIITPPSLAAQAAPDGLGVRKVADGQVWEIVDGDQTVLRYNYQIVPEPAAVKDRITADNRKYAVPRCDYIHPLFGPNGEVLTDDWLPDHPHHRGIYWAWPEVDWHGKRGDLHALQHVFARPTGKIDMARGPDFAQITAENRWQWEDGTPIVRELATIRAHGKTVLGRCVDLSFRFTALGDDVQVARRGTSLYGGLNIRLSPAADQRITPFTDPPGATPRRTWAERIGIPRDGKSVVGLTILQSPGNPDYPGDWVQYPEISWIQPTFPAAGTRYTISKDRPLELHYRVSIHEGMPSQETLKRLWNDYAREVTAKGEP
jgi:hypothetical protein